MAGIGRFGGFSLGKRKEGSYSSFDYHYGDPENKRKHYKTEDE